ncbi:MerR family transcriptional regulator [Nocardia sp. NPDC058705]|uniref:DNA polymerase III subunit beta family protein n=1 Tax=Nocardia sp. NPDC058705 TaxID=3346609 RepID=UPI0036C84B7A
MPDTELITIGAFARACGLSASALRFYADAGVLTPAVIDEATGYRYYAPDQSAPARLLRHLRAVDMPLPAVTALLTEPDPLRAIALLDHHLTDLDRHQATIRTAATAARAALLTLHGSESELSGGSSDQGAAATATRDARLASHGSDSEPGSGGSDQGAARLDCSADGRSMGASAVTASPVAMARNAEHRFEGAPRTHRDDLWVSGPALAAAIDQVATATVADPAMRVLDTILFEANTQELILTATDRYRLATRTLRPTRPAVTPWTATIDAEDLRSAVSWLRRQYSVAIAPTPDGIEFATAAEDSDASSVAARGGGIAGSVNSEFGAAPDARHCRCSAEDFPDYRAMLAALPPVRTRVVLARADLLDALENASAPTVALRMFPPSTVIVTPGGSVPRQDDRLADVHDTGGERVTSGASMPDGLGPSGAPRSAGGATGTAASERYANPEKPLVQVTERALPATITGPSMTLHFTVTTLYPAAAGAVGPDVMLDLIASDLPVLVRSADDGALSTLTMPCEPAR